MHVFKRNICVVLKHYVAVLLPVNHINAFYMGLCVSGGSHKKYTYMISWKYNHVMLQDHARISLYLKEKQKGKSCIQTQRRPIICCCSHPIVVFFIQLASQQPLFLSYHQHFEPPTFVVAFQQHWQHLDHPYQRVAPAHTLQVPCLKYQSFSWPS